MSLVQPAVSAIGSVISDDPPCNHLVRKIFADLGIGGKSHLAGSLTRGCKIDYSQHKKLHRELRELACITKQGKKRTISCNCD